jgi:hypothetical protein
MRLVRVAGASLLLAAGLQIVTSPAASAAAPAEIEVIAGNPGMTNAGVTLNRGILRHIQAQPVAGSDTPAYQLSNHAIGPGDDSAPNADGGTLRNPLPCQAGVACVRAVDSFSWGMAYLGTDAAGAVRVQYRKDKTVNESTEVAGTGAALVDASPTEILVDVAGPQQSLRSTGLRWNVPDGPAALWFKTLWTNGPAGRLTATTYETTIRTETVASGAACVIDDLRAAQHYVLWSCGENGAEGAGVVDRVRNRTITLPAGRYLLGDGYAVRHDAATGDLLRYDLTGDTLGEPARVGTFASGALADDRGITWAVDRFGGHIAWVDAANAVHIVDPAVRRSAPTVGDRTAFNGLAYPGRQTPARGVWAMTSPVDSWTFTVTRVKTGEIVATRTGGPQRNTVIADWDGRLASGAKAPSGNYRSTLEATADGLSTRSAESGITVLCGTPAFRSYECSGRPTVLGVLPNDEGHWLTLYSGGLVHDNGPHDTWDLGTGGAQKTSALVPFGDLNADDNNDLLVRNGVGALTVHYGDGTSSFKNRPTKVVGSGWNGMRQILTSGDVTGDRIPDVLAVDATGAMRRYNGTAAGGIANGVVVPGTWAYPKLIGPGDVTGDGKADLYAVNATGQLELRPGTGTGTFGAAQRVGTGWSPYTILAGGDVTDDNRNDLVARDSAGTFWLYPGNGTGGFGARKQLDTDYQKYAGLY